MNLEKLEEKLHTQIPMTKLMNLKINNIDENYLYTTAPLDININDKGTAFGGSLSTITIISSWSLVELLVKKFAYEKSKIAIVTNNTEFKAPVTKDIFCKTYLPTIEEIETLKNKLKTKKSGSIKIKSQIIEDNKICVDFLGVYVIKI